MTLERVVLDTNVLISAVLRQQGPPGQVHDALRLRQATYLFSEPTFEELRSRIMRPKFDRYVPTSLRLTFLAQLEAISEEVAIFECPMGCRDADDDKFLETALLGEADALITGDKALLEMNPFNGLPVIQPVDALHRLNLGRPL